MTTPNRPRSDGGSFRFSRPVKDAPGGKLVEYAPEGGEYAALPPRNDLLNHSPDGFEWGYSGSGPAQLALAILAKVTGDDQFAVKHHQQFKTDLIAPMSQTASEIIWPANHVLTWCRSRDEWERLKGSTLGPA